MSRPKRQLLDRIVDGSFRPERYGHLVRDEELPEEPPPEPFRRGETPPRVWAWLRHLQKCYRWAEEAGDLDEAQATMHDFALLVRYLHGGRRPGWFDDVLERRFEEGLAGKIALLDLVLDGTFVARRHEELLESDPLLPDDETIARMRRDRLRRGNGGRG